MATAKEEVEDSKRRYAVAHAGLGLVIEAGRSTDGLISNRELPHPIPVGAIIATTMMAHAISLRRILPVPDGPEEMFDVPSAAVITRSIAECYVAFRYYAVEPKTNADKRFRGCLARHHGLAKHVKLLQGLGVDDKLALAIESRDRERASLEADQIFQVLPRRTKEQIRDATASMHLTAEAVAEASGVPLESWRRLYVTLSQYAHSSPLAVVYATYFDPNSRAANASLNMITQWAGGMVAKMLVDMGVLVPGSDAQWTEPQREAVLVHLGVLERSFVLM